MSLTHLLHKFRHGPAIYVARLVENRAHNKLSRNAALYTLLQKYQQNSVSTGASYADYWALYSWVRRHKPHEVLECGTGVSTVVIAQALRENYKEEGIQGRVTSMEEDVQYYEMARSLFPEELATYGEIVFSPAIEDHYHFFRGVRYASIPERSYDFVYVDGPSLHTSPKSEHMAINMDFISIVQRNDRPVSAMIDTRTATCYVYSLLFPRTFRYDYVRRIGLVLPSTKKDLVHPRNIVAAAMRAHKFRRPSIYSFFADVF